MKIPYLRSIILGTCLGLYGIYLVGNTGPYYHDWQMPVAYSTNETQVSQLRYQALFLRMCLIGLQDGAVFLLVPILTCMVIEKLAARRSEQGSIRFWPRFWLCYVCCSAGVFLLSCMSCTPYDSWTIAHFFGALGLSVFFVLSFSAWGILPAVSVLGALVLQGYDLCTKRNECL